MASDEKTVPKSYRLPAAQVAFIDSLASKQILGANSSTVLRALINIAIKDLIERDFVKKYFETEALLRKSGL